MISLLSSFEILSRKTVHTLISPIWIKMAFCYTLHCLFINCSLQFLLIFRKAAAGELSADSGLLDLYTQLNEIDVDKEGVMGAKGFFESKVMYHIVSR